MMEYQGFLRTGGARIPSSRRWATIWIRLATTYLMTCTATSSQTLSCLTMSPTISASLEYRVTKTPSESAQNTPEVQAVAQRTSLQALHQRLRNHRRPCSRPKKPKDCLSSTIASGLRWRRSTQGSHIQREVYMHLRSSREIRYGRRQSVRTRRRGPRRR